MLSGHVSELARRRRLVQRKQRAADGQAHSHKAHGHSIHGQSGRDVDHPVRDREPQARHRDLAVQQEQNTRDAHDRVLLLPQGLSNQSDRQHDPRARAVVEFGDSQGQARRRGLLFV